MQRFGATTVARWLSEELPTGVRAYIEDGGELFELVGLEATSGRILPKIKVHGWRSVFVPRATRLVMGTPVILSLSENLTGQTLAAIADQVCRAASGSFALPSGGRSVDATVCITE